MALTDRTSPCFASLFPHTKTTFLKKHSSSIFESFIVVFEDNFQPFHSCKKTHVSRKVSNFPSRLTFNFLPFSEKVAESNAFRNPLAGVERIVRVAQSHAARGPRVRAVVALRHGFVGQSEPTAENDFQAAAENSQGLMNKEWDSSCGGDPEVCSTAAWAPLGEPGCKHLVEDQSSARETVVSKIEHLHSVACLDQDVKAGFDRACYLTVVTQLTNKTDWNDLRKRVQASAVPFEGQGCPLVVVSALHSLRERTGVEQVGLLLERETAGLYR